MQNGSEWRINANLARLGTAQAIETSRIMQNGSERRINANLARLGTAEGLAPIAESEGPANRNEGARRPLK
jgi:hypothetical protein